MKVRIVQTERYYPLMQIVVGLLVLIATVLAACNHSAPTATPPSALADTLVFSYWPDYFPQTILDRFSAEYGVKVRYVGYASYEEAIQEIGGDRQYDVVIVNSTLIPGLIRENLLATLNYQHLPNSRNIAANFRDLIYDPNNNHSIPYQWGTTGLLVRSDLVTKPVSRWADLWDPAFAGKVALWPIQTDLLPIALKSLGYSANSEDPTELADALQHLLRLRNCAFLLSNEMPSVVPILESGKAVISFGWNYDALLAETASAPIQYILPQEGTILWSESYVIPANSSHQYTAEIFLNFMLRPEISAQIVNEFYYAVPNEMAVGYIEPQIRNNPNVFPPKEMLENAEMNLPLSSDGQKLWNQVWERFMAAD